MSQTFHESGRSSTQKFRWGPRGKSFSNHPVYSSPADIFFVSCLQNFFTQIVCNVDSLLNDSVVHIHDIEAAVRTGREIDRAEISVCGGNELAGAFFVPVGQLDMTRIGVAHCRATNKAAYWLTDEIVAFDFIAEAVPAEYELPAGGRERFQGAVLGPSHAGSALHVRSNH